MNKILWKSDDYFVAQPNDLFRNAKRTKEKAFPQKNLTAQNRTQTPMKTNASLLRRLAASTALMLAAATQTSFAQTTATTDPVGFITLNVSGGGTTSAPKTSLVSPTLTNPVLWQGLITNITTSGNTNTITVSGTPWTANQFNGVPPFPPNILVTHYVEIIATATPPSAAVSGTLADITATTTSTITTGQLTSAGIGDTIKIRKDVTISDLFGATNSAGLLATGDASTADEVLIYNFANKTQYYYYDGSFGGAAGWYDLAFNPSGNVTIAPNDAVVIRRKANAPVSVVFSGAVKTGNTLIPIANGLNVLGTASAMGLTLNTSGLYTGSSVTGVLASGDASTADQIILYSNGGATQTSYYYYDGSFGGAAGWYDLAFNAAGNIAIAPGTAFVLKRFGGGAAFNWVLPSPTSF